MNQLDVANLFDALTTDEIVLVLGQDSRWTLPRWSRNYHDRMGRAYRRIESMARESRPGRSVAVGRMEAA